jgi:hypothetical protein
MQKQERVDDRIGKWSCRVRNNRHHQNLFDSVKKKRMHRTFNSSDDEDEDDKDDHNVQRLTGIHYTCT